MIRREGTLKSTAGLNLLIALTSTKLDDLKEALKAGEFDRSLHLAEEANAESPDNPEVRELYAVTHLAAAIRLSDAAREARRLELIRRDIDYDVEFEDSPEVNETFQRALSAIDDVLRIEPTHWKALMLKASLLFRKDREHGRPQALEILHALAEANPSNKQVPFTIRKIERPCPRCGDTGFCPYCKGRGTKRFLRMDRKCEQCYGRGICPACGVL